MCDRGLSLLSHLRRPDSVSKENPSFRAELDQLRSDFYFITGKIHHAQEQFEEANIAYA